MAFDLTQNARRASQENSIEINIVFEIDGVDRIYGAIPIQKFVRIGDPGLIIGDPDIDDNAFFIGGFNLVDDQLDAISLDGTTTTITQQLQIDKGRSSGVGTFQVSLLDIAQEITRLITPDETQNPTFDILGRKCRVYLGFLDTAWPEDYITIFRGTVADLTPAQGTVRFTINSPENKQRATIYTQASSELAAAVAPGDTVLNVSDASDFLTAIIGPGGSTTNAFEGIIRINDELIGYTDIVGNQFQGLSRGLFGTVPATHSIENEVLSNYRLQGNPMTLALQLMASGRGGPYVEDVEIFNIFSGSNTITTNSINLNQRFGLRLGDFVSITGAINPANDIFEAEVIGLEVDDDANTIITVDATLIDELETTGTLSIRSQFDVLPAGLLMGGDEIDVEQHEFIRNTFIPSFQLDFKLKEQIEDGKEFLEDQIYSPFACFSIPRNAQASVGYHIGPIPGQDIRTLTQDNIKNPRNLALKRSTERYFFNEVVYRFNEDVLEDRFLGGTVIISQDSKNRIPEKTETLTIDARGLTTLNSAENIATLSAQRRLDRYQFGAEFIDVQLFFGSSFQLEIGDIVVLDGQGLNIADIQNGSRDLEPRLMEIQQKRLGLKDGSVQVTLADTNFDGSQRFGLIGPSSIIQAGISDTELIISPSFSEPFGVNEFEKYQRFMPNLFVRVRSKDFTRNATSQVANFAGNNVILVTPLGFTPQAGDVFELAKYPDVSRQTNLIHGFISANAGDDFADGEPSYVIL